MADDAQEGARDHGLRVIQPPMWEGMQKGGGDSPMVCCGCDDWERCARRGYCRIAPLSEYDSRDHPAVQAARDLLPVRIALCPDPNHAQEFYVPVEEGTTGAICPMCPLPMSTYVREES